MQRNPIICFFLFISFFIEAQYTDQINSNRPGLSIGAFAVGKDVVQAEVGIAYRHYAHSGYNNSTFDGGVGFLSLRWGFLMETLELTYEGKYILGTLNSKINSIPSLSTRKGFLQNFIGVKYLLYDPFKKEKSTNVYSWKANNGFKLRELIPAVSLTLGTNINFESNNPFPYNNIFGNLYRPIFYQNLNVPLDKETMVITDDTRIRAAAPTIKHVLEQGGSVVLMSHLGRPKDGPEDKFSLRHIVAHTSKVLGVDVKFTDDCIGEKALEMSSSLKPGEVLMLENVRFHKRETAGTESFAEELAKYGDVYINDAFGTAHRAHASTTIVAKFFPNDKMFGYLIEGEIKAVDKVLNSTEEPLTAIVGGAKVSSKITIIERLLDKVDNLIVGGGMAYTFVKANGGKVGSSLVEDDYLDVARKIMSDAKAKGVNLYIPTDTVIADKFDNEANRKTVKIDEIPDGWMGLDTGAETSEACREIILNSKLILWNGPMGVFEMENFQQGTVDVANAIVDATSKGAFSLIGGGDSVAAINKFKLADKVSYVSTGGGAMLEYLEGIELPGIKAIRQ